MDVLQFENLLTDEELLLMEEPISNENKKEEEEEALDENMFRSPLEIYYYVQKQAQPSFSLHALLSYWKHLQFSTLTKYVQKHTRMKYIQDRWSQVLTHPEEVATEIKECTRKVTHITPFTVCKPLNMQKLSWNQEGTHLLSNEADELLHTFYKPNRNCFLLMRVQNVDDLLLVEKYVNMAMSWIKTLFEKRGPFVKFGMVSGSAGIGKKTLLRLLFNDLIWLEVKWISFAESEEDQETVFKSVIDDENRKVDVPLKKLTSRTRQWVIVIYDCDYLDSSGNQILQKIWSHCQQLCNKKSYKHQVLILFVTSNPFVGILNRIRTYRNVKHLQLYPKNSSDFRTFYGEVRKRMRQKSEEPLDPKTFPLRAEQNVWLNQICDRRDVRAFLNWLSFLWVTMDGVRTFPSFETNSTERCIENKVGLNCFDIVDYIVLRHAIPPSLQPIARQKSSHLSTTLLYQLLGVNLQVNTYQMNLHSIHPSLLFDVYKFQSKRDIALFPLMVIHNMFPYGQGFSNPKEYQKALFNVSLHELNPVSLGIKYNKSTTFEVHQSFDQILSKIAEYQEYKHYVPHPEKYLLKDLITVPTVNNNTGWGAFKVEYCAIRKDVRLAKEGFLSKKDKWLHSWKMEDQIFLFSFDSMHIIQCFGLAIEQYKHEEDGQGDTKSIITIDEKSNKTGKVMIPQEKKKRKAPEGPVATKVPKRKKVTEEEKKQKQEKKEKKKPVKKRKKVEKIPKQSLRNYFNAYNAIETSK